MQYGSFAHCYDRMMHDVDYGMWTEYLASLLQKSGVRTVLDCACGTGKITIGLAKRGFSVIGCDCSEDMLMEARANALHAGMKMLPFVCCDMTEVRAHRPVDALISTCDGVNYLCEPKRVDAFFQNANACLKPGGLLLFDVSSAYKLSEMIGERTFTEIEDDYAYIWENEFDANNRILEMNLTFFVREGSLYRRFSEVHRQRAHTETELTDSLLQSGFTVLGVFDSFSRNPVRCDSERIQFIAKKNEE